MRISSKGEYGLRALFDLAQRYGEGPIQSHDIHLRQGIDENYLNQILIVLRKAGLIDSVRGPQGGHRLARPPRGALARPTGGGPIGGATAAPTGWTSPGTAGASVSVR